MRWGAHSAEFVRPVHSVVLLYGDEVVPVEVLGLASGRVTSGHRFHSPKPITLKDAKSYESKLRRARVVADFAKRRETDSCRGDCCRGGGRRGLPRTDRRGRCWMR